MTVSETYGDEDAMSEAKLRGIMSDVERILKDCEYETVLEYMNGIPYIRTTFSSNHRTREVDSIPEVHI